MKIGPHQLPNRVLAAPMAGIADRPLRRLWRALGAGYVVGEMASADPRLRASAKTARRLHVDAQDGLRVVQLAGADPSYLADAARYSVDQGAQIIDINMGCPVKKVCNAACGSALLRDEALVARIIEIVVAAVPVPVTLKYRTGWAPQERNAVRIGRLAEDAGIQMLTLHGRTRACGFRGQAEYDTIAAVKAQVRIPVVANGDIDSPEKAREVLAYTGADAVMIGRAAQERPWIFREIDHFLRTGTKLAPIHISKVHKLLLAYLDEHYFHYGEVIGARTARKRIHFLTRGLVGAELLRGRVNATENSLEQRQALQEFLLEAAARAPVFEYIDAAASPASEEFSRGKNHELANAKMPELAQSCLQ